MVERGERIAHKDNIPQGCDPLRESLFNWYEFRPDKKILLLNAGGDGIPEFFLRKGLEVFLNAEPGQSFDYIVAVNCLETEADPAAAVKHWTELLSFGGTLLLTVENRYGLKYFSGAVDPHTGISFDGPGGYLESRGSKGRADSGSRMADGGKCFSRAELLAILSDAGVSEKAYQFFYPVPDGRMPQMIFSDSYMKGTNAAERLADYNYADKNMLLPEHRILPEMIDSGALPFLSNTFLLEITKEGSLSDIIYAVPTTDRGSKHGMATTIRKNGIVLKRPLWPEGRAELLKLHAYTKELSEKGIPVVKTQFGEDEYGPFLSMPRIEAEGLSTALPRIAETDQPRFLRIFDKIAKANEAAYGAETKSAYIDLAPCNAFLLPDDEILFYDQEFRLSDVPVEFAMFRTLKYFYASARKVETLIPKAFMHQRYGITEEMIPKYEMMEHHFISAVRHTETYGELFKAASPDYKHMKKLAEQYTAAAEASAGKPYRIGYVPGVFDLFHTGHLILLEKCKARCEHLIVGVLTDELVQFYKGHGTVISYEDRARVIEGLKVVDEVIPVDFSNTDKLDAWEQLHYDCHFSGDDHVNHWNDVLVELKKRGSNMEFFPYTQGISSTEIRQKMKG